MEILCSKKGGVCSLALYRRDPHVGARREINGSGDLVTLCPNRFEEADLITGWIGSTLLDDDHPIVVKEVDFLMPLGPDPNDSADDRGEGVGKIDRVLIARGDNPLRWCAMELQAVYFSGAEMGKEFPAIELAAEGIVPFPVFKRHPDFRSSGPKRLMPQLQIKIPSLRRWGKKMAVVVDRAFFNTLGRMEPVSDMSNADIAWFVVDFRYEDGRFRLIKDAVHFTTLERAVEGLTAGNPVSLSVFEQRLRSKLARIVG